MATCLVLVGGFLGAGKTTLLLQAARRLIAQGYRVGLVANDQGQGLVDTALAQQQGIPVAEVAGGCFCCRFPDLLAALRQLQEMVQPEVILAEPVGSCTDLMATVLRPLQTYYSGQFQLAPLTILLDSQRQMAAFPAMVDYLYRRQLAEAEVIALNKSDLFDPITLDEKRRELQATYPQAQVMSLSARTGAGLAEWLELVLGASSRIETALDLDYATYAEAEACLGWLNAKGALAAGRPFSPAEWLTETLTHLGQTLAAQGAAIAHLKLHLTTLTAALKASLTQSDGAISWDLRPTNADTEWAEFILNARVNTDPHTLETIVRQVVPQVKPPPDLTCHFTQFECFSPLPPKPTYRLLERI
ncbi:MAG: cobalamin biosynthesis protein [Chloroflexi bacterium]|nr:cobalamin biosynthesis protein [Chloroflexota bacterium]